MPPPITTTSKRWPAIASVAAARASISRGRWSPARPGAARGAPSPGAGGPGGGGRRSARGLEGPQHRGRRASAASRGCARSRGGRGGVQVLLVLNRVGAKHAGDDDEGGGAIELGRPLWTGRFLEARQGRRPEDAEAPRRGQGVVGRPARQ